MAGATLPLTLGRARTEQLASAAYFLRRNPRMIIGGLIVLLWVFVALFAPFVAPYDPKAVKVDEALQPPNPQIQNAMIAIGIVAIPGYARLTRGQVLAVRAREFIVAARTIGAPPLRIVMRHVFPNVMNALIVQATLSTAFAILAEAALSFLGLGTQPPDPSWGQDINYSQRYLPNLKWWMSVA